MIYVIFVSNIVAEALCNTELCHVHLSQPVKVMSMLSWDLSKVSPAIKLSSILKEIPVGRKEEIAQTSCCATPLSRHYLISLCNAYLSHNNCTWKFNHFHKHRNRVSYYYVIKLVWSERFSFVINCNIHT